MTTYLPLNDGQELRVEVYHDAGGMNYATYKNEPRGIYLSATPVRREHCGNGMSVEGFSAFSGYKILLEEAKRLNRKRVAELFEQAQAEIQARSGPAWDLVQKVLARNGITLKEPLHEETRAAAERLG